MKKIEEKIYNIINKNCKSLVSDSTVSIKSMVAKIAASDIDIKMKKRRLKEIHNKLLFAVVRKKIKNIIGG